MRTAWEPALDRAHDQLALLSRSDKIAIALHDFASVSDPDVMVFDYADGPNGVRGHVGATAFPSMLAMAASFDRQLAAAYGVALAQETVAAGRNVIFSPGLDIVRVPWGGRTGQQLSEDPFLAGEIGGVIGAAVQSQGVMAMATHYVANNFEWLRTGANSLPRRTPAIDVRVSQRTLHEIYLEPFRRALAGHGVASYMGSYNRLNGEYVCQSAEILNLPRQAWGWAGVSLPDFIFAVRDPRAALLAGLDLPSLGDAAGRTDADLDELGEDRLEELVLHVLTAAAHVGLRRPAAAVPDPPAGSAELARRMVADGMVLLRNEDSLLPLASPARVAVIDAVGMRNVLVMGGAASVSLVDERIRSVAECLGEALGAEVVEQSVGHGEQPLPPLDAAVEVVARDAISGAERQLTLDRFELATPEGIGPDWSAELRTQYRAEQAGPHTVTCEFSGQLTLYADGKSLVSGFREASPMVIGPHYVLHAVLDLAEGQVVELRVEYATSVAISVPGLPVAPHLCVGVAGPDDELARAVALAADSDVAVVLAGRLSGEAMDVESLHLPGRQSEIIAAVAAANPRTVLVTSSANPVVLPDAEPAAWLHAWFPGEQFAEGLADVLTGTVEPGGRLPISFPADEQQTPMETAAQYPGVDGVATYSEELLVGYRWYDEREVEPAYPFGFGLGYTTFELSELDGAEAGDGFQVSFEVRNTGARRGKAVPQVYVGYAESVGEPPRQLKAFDAVRLDAGKSLTLNLEISRDDLAVYDEASDARIFPSGELTFSAGFSSRDIRASTKVSPAQP